MASNVQALENNEFVTSNSTQVSGRHRTPSFSSMPSDSWDSFYGSFSSSSFPYFEDYPAFSPMTPLEFKGIPFSWEKIPGIPKHHLGSKKKEYSGSLLPLPPAGSSNSAAKKSIHQGEISPKKSNRFQSDPFMVALVECSKDGDEHHQTMWKGSSKNIITRSLSDRFSFMNYTSCKRTCSVSRSTVYVRSRPNAHLFLGRRST